MDNITSSPGGNNIQGPPSIDHSLPHGVSNLQDALANIDRKKQDAPMPGGRKKRRRKSRRKSRKSKRKSRKGKKKRKTRRKKNRSRRRR